MHLKLVATFLLLAVASTQSAELYCDYIISPYQTRVYECVGKITTNPTDYTVESITGNHIAGMSNDQVSEVMFSNVSMQVFPKNLLTWFKNYDEFGVANVANFPNFKREMFGEFAHLTYFFAYNLPMVTEIPRDAFFDMTRLTSFFLDGMTNMGNLNSDLLINAPNLERFSARGPNQVTQINPGFFRKQMRTLTTVDFRDTKLARISYTTFVNFKALRDARFVNSGCLNRIYFQQVAIAITADIRSRCQDVTGHEDNEIRRNPQSSSSSSSTESH